MSTPPDNGLDFSSILASSIHDMKNSLGMLLNSLEELVEQRDDECHCSPDKASRLQYEAKRVNDNLVQLLTLYRLGNDQYLPQFEEYALTDFLDECYLLDKPLLDFRGITFELSVEENLHWYFDRELVAGVIGNVVNNALRYTRDIIRITASEETGMLRITVEDNGNGFPEAMLVIGNEAESGIDFNAGHTGLGLHFSRQVAAQHRNRNVSGFIRMDNGSDLGGGRFHLYLP